MASATDYKVVGNIANTASATELRVGAQPTILQGDPADNKQVFDNYCDMIATRHNQLCDFVAADVSAEVALSVKTLYHNLGWVATP